MKECGKCGFQNEDDAGFCGKCGAPCGRPGNAAAPGNPDAGAGTAVKCEKCQAENSPEAKFCGSCGAAVQGDDAWQAEWKAEGNKNLGAFPYVIAGLSFIPGIGIVFGIAAIIWGIFTARKGGPKLAFIGMCGILLSLLLFGSLYYFGLVRRTGVFADLRSKLTVTVADQAVQAIEFYKVKTGKYPESLNELIGSLPAGSAAIAYDPSRTDASGAPRMLYYELINPNQYYLFSVGDDNIPFTKDDILPSVQPAGGLGYTIKP